MRMNHGLREIGLKKIKVYKGSAYRRGKTWKIDTEYALLLFTMPCVYCGQEPLPGKLGGIDRYNNEKGYTNQNSMPCCGVCNLMKKDHTEEFFVNHCRRIVRNAKNREFNEAGERYREAETAEQGNSGNGCADYPDPDC